MNRIMIIGSGGAGKSTLARQLGEKLGLEVIHLDAEFWRSGWTKTPKEEWQRKVSALAARDRWVMDGNFSSTLEIRIAAADTIIFLDFPRLLCLWRVVKRWYRYRGVSRPDMAPGCPEKVDFDFIKWIWTFPNDGRQRITSQLDRLDANKRVIVLRSPREAKALLGNPSGSSLSLVATSPSRPSQRTSQGDEG